MTVRIERHGDPGRRATVWLDRPPLNILDLETIAALDAAIAGLADDEAPPLLVLRGAGPKAFSAGVSVEDHTPDKVGAMLAGFHGVIRRLDAYPAVTVAAVDGHCLGGGMELALVCDLVVASERSRFGQPEIELGCYPPVAAALYPRLAGSPRANDLLLTGRKLSAAEAESMGLVSRIAPAERFAEELAALLDSLDAKSAAVLALTKRALRAGREQPFSLALDTAERLYLQDLTQTEDMIEGTNAFLARRAPVWRHR